MSTAKFSVVILTKNSDKHLEACLASAAFADEVLILDSGSTDNTLTIAEQMGVRIEHAKWLGFGLQKARAVNLATYDWVFVLDSDEQITKALANEIRTVLHNPDYYVYKVPRLNRFFGRWIYHGGLYPDMTIRLFNRKHAHFNERAVHEKVVTLKPVGALKSDIRHEAYDSIDAFIQKQNRYALLSAKKRSVIKACLSSHWTFIRMFFLKQGFRDGWHGYIIAKLYSQYSFWKYIQ